MLPTLLYGRGEISKQRSVYTNEWEVYIRWYEMWNHHELYKGNVLSINLPIVHVVTGTYF